MPIVVRHKDIYHHQPVFQLEEKFETTVNCLPGTSRKLRRDLLRKPRILCCAYNPRTVRTREEASLADCRKLTLVKENQLPSQSCKKNSLKSRLGPLQTCRSKKLGSSGEKQLRFTSDKDVEATYSGLDDSQGLEAGVIPESRLTAEDPTSASAQASTSGRLPYGSSAGSILYPPAQRNHIRESW